MHRISVDDFIDDLKRNPFRTPSFVIGEDGTITRLEDTLWTPDFDSGSIDPEAVPRLKKLWAEELERRKREAAGAARKSA